MLTKYQNKIVDMHALNLKKDAEIKLYYANRKAYAKKIKGNKWLKNDDYKAISTTKLTGFKYY